MASLYRLCGAVLGALTGLVYAAMAWTLVAPLVVALAASTRGVAAGVAADRLEFFVTETIGFALAGYLLLVLGSYVLYALLGGASGPIGWAGPLGYLVFTFPLVVYTIAAVVILAVLNPIELLVSLSFAVAFLLGFCVLVAVAYVVAATFSPSSGAVTLQESVARGYLIGLNVALNGVLAAVAYTILLTPLLGSNGGALALVLTVVVVTVNLLAVFCPVGPAGAGPAAQGAIEALLGWTSWLSPMAWLVTGLGCLLSHLTWIAHVTSWAFPATFPSGTYVVQRAVIDAASGTMVTRGGIVGTLSGTAFDMGSYAFFSPTYTGATPAEAVQHEVGHALSLAALGSAFHFVGAVDEIVFQRWWDAYPERIAQSNVPGTPRAIVKMWS